MDKLQEVIFREELESLKKMIRCIETRYITIGHHDFQENYVGKILAMDKESVLKIVDETSKIMYPHISKMEKSITRLELVLESIKNGIPNQ